MARSGLKVGTPVNVIRSMVSGADALSSAIFYNTGKIVKKTSGRAMVDIVGSRLWFDDEALSVAKQS